MSTTRISPRHRVVALALMLALGLAPQARTAEDDAKLREQALALNDITGNDPIKGKIKEFIGNTAATKKLLAVAARMSKEKDQPFNFNAAQILATVSYAQKDYDTSERFYKICLEQALKLQSGQKIAQAATEFQDAQTGRDQKAEVAFQQPMIMTFRLPDAPRGATFVE